MGVLETPEVLWDTNFDNVITVIIFLGVGSRFAASSQRCDLLFLGFSVDEVWMSIRGFLGFIFLCPFIFSVHSKQTRKFLTGLQDRS